MSGDCEQRLQFEMGLYKAYFPTDRVYVSTHFWFKTLENGRVQAGISAYAARLLTDLFRIDWKINAGDRLEIEQVLGEVESTKASSELYSPLAATVTAVNAASVDDPSAVSLEPYENWLLEFDAMPAETMTPDEYIRFLADGWEETVKLLKGQV